MGVKVKKVHTYYSYTKAVNAKVINSEILF